VDAALTDCPLEVMPELLLLKGQSLLDQASDRRELLRAGSAFMRLAIHFADDRRAPQGLFGAAKVHQRIDRPDKAIQLLQECLAHAKIEAALRAEATAELDRLTAGE